MELKPRVGVGELKLGMSPEEVMAIAGTPKLKRKTIHGEDEFIYEDFNVAFSSSGARVIHIGVVPTKPLWYRNRDIFSDPVLWQELLAEDGDPYEYVGVIILLSLQLTLTGFHDNDPAQKAVTVLAKGSWDHLRSKCKPFDLAAPERADN